MAAGVNAIRKTLPSVSETAWGNKEMKWWVEQNAQLIEVYYLRTPDDFYLRIYLYDPVVQGSIHHLEAVIPGLL